MSIWAGHDAYQLKITKSLSKPSLNTSEFHQQSICEHIKASLCLSIKDGEQGQTCPSESTQTVANMCSDEMFVKMLLCQRVGKTLMTCHVSQFSQRVERVSQLKWPKVQEFCSFRLLWNRTFIRTHQLNNTHSSWNHGELWGWTNISETWYFL